MFECSLTLQMIVSIIPV